MNAHENEHTGDAHVNTELWRWRARQLRDAVATRELSAVEVVEAHLTRIEAVNPRVNAIVTLVPERALAEAAALDRSREPAGLLQGLPIAIKDLVDTAGIRTTYGSPVYADHVPLADAMIVQRLRAAGAVIVGKTNTPEFGAGSHTFNPVFGATRNPYDLARSAGGSSGGAAAALAARMIPIADGSDLGGSLRNPASFCNVVGLRPSPGRIPSTGPGNGWDPMSVLGPMARTVDDAALLLAAIAGPDPSAPLSIDADPSGFAAISAAELSGWRIGWSETVDGLPVEPEVTAALEPSRQAMTALGAIVEHVEPDLTGADEVFETFRSLAFLAGDDYVGHDRSLVKPELVDDMERGERLTPRQIVRAATLRTDLFRRLQTMLERYDLLAMPTVQLPPFDLELRWPEIVAGVPMERYITWMRSCSRISATTLPALSLPAGFTRGGLPVGLQLVGRHRKESELLAGAMALEVKLDASARLPALE